MNFHEEHQRWLEYHIKSRKGERRNRLERGHRHGERLFLKQVWWPLKGNLNHLHPEYEVMDWRRRPYFADFAWLPGSGVKLIIEIKGYGPHVMEMDRQKYSAELNRETFLHGAGFHVISFAYDDVEQRPELCIMLLRMVLGRYLPEQPPVDRAKLEEKEILRLAIQLARPIRPKDIENHMGVDHKTAIRMLRRLCAKRWLILVRRGESQRIVCYQLAKGAFDYFD